MTRMPVVRELKLAHAAVGASVLAIPGTAAAALAGGTPHRAPAAEPRGPVRIHLSRHARSAIVNEPVTIHGWLMPDEAHRRIRLQERGAGAWHTVGSGWTGSRGGFRLRFDPVALGSSRLRVALGRSLTFSTNATSKPLGPGRSVTASAGSLTVYRQSMASWYYDGGTTACGFHAQYGVANVGLPCGTRVAFRYGGRRVIATVDDRGPYVDGREWDLNQNTAAALGFSGIALVLSSR